MNTSTETWHDRVRAADAEAEKLYGLIFTSGSDRLPADVLTTRALIAIAAELRAQRIARRPGTGQ